MPTVFDHIALATHSIADAPALLVGELGGVSGYGGPSGDFRWWHWDYEGGGRIEVIEPDRVFDSKVVDYQKYRETKRDVDIGFSEPGAYVVRMEGGSVEVTVSAELELTLRGPVQEVYKGSLTQGFLDSLA